LGEDRIFSPASLSEMTQGELRAVRDSGTGEQEWEFRCECGREHCHDYVFLTLDAYVALRDRGTVVLADGHHLSPVVRARRLRDDARALVAQALNQLERAKRNLGTS
jgi:hypothetical protein